MGKLSAVHFVLAEAWDIPGDIPRASLGISSVSCISLTTSKLRDVLLVLEIRSPALDSTAFLLLGINNT